MKPLLSIGLGIGTAAAAEAAPAAAVTPSYSGVLPMVVSLLVVIGVILLAAWLAKRTRLIIRMPVGLKVGGSLSLGVREKVVVVEVDGRRFLLGTTPSQINLLAELSPPPPGTETVVQGEDFSRLLKIVLGKGEHR